MYEMLILVQDQTENGPTPPEYHYIMSMKSMSWVMQKIYAF